MRIVVTGASGGLGGHVVKALLRRVSASDLILVSRSPERLAPLAAAGALVRYGDFSQPESLSAAFNGGERALVISTMPPGDARVVQHRNAFEAAARAGVRQIVYTSYPNPIEANPAPPVPSHRLSEQALHQVDVPWTIVRNALFSDLRVQLAVQYARDRQWTTNVGHGVHAYVTRDDCAAAAASVLTTSGHEGRTYEVTGPQLVGSSEFVALLEEFSGRRIRCSQVDDAAYEQYRVGFEADPRNSSYFELWTATGQAIRGGYLSQLTTTVQDLTGADPIPMRQLFEMRRSAFEATSSS